MPHRAPQFRSLSLLAGVLLFAACGGQTQEELPFDRVTLGLYTQPLVAQGAGKFVATYPRDDVQYAEVELLPDRGLYVFLVAGTMALTLPEAPEVGSTLTLHELTLEVLEDDFFPGRWMVGAELRLEDSVAECFEHSAAGASWRWQSVGDLRITTQGGQGRETLPWRRLDEYTGSTSESGGKLTLFPPTLRFAHSEELP